MIDAIFYLSAATAIMALIDILLTEAQKDRISDKILKLWSWLDDLKRRSLIALTRWNLRNVLILFVVMGAIALVPAALNYKSGPMLVLSVVLGIGVFLVGILAFLVLIPLIFVFIATVVVSVAEFVARRIAESPKPVFAASALIAAIVGVLRIGS
jgi:hypothetical protein